MNRTSMRILLSSLVLLACGWAHAETITVGGLPARLEIRAAGSTGLRISLLRLDRASVPAQAPGWVGGDPGAPAIVLRRIDGVMNWRIGSLYLAVVNDPLSIDVSTGDGRSVQNVVLDEGGSLSFRLDRKPVLGLGTGGPPAGDEWRDEVPEYDRRGRLHEMRPRRQRQAYGPRNPVPLLIGTAGWALFVNAPQVAVDLRDDRRGFLLPGGGESAGSAESPGGTSPGGGAAIADFFIFDAGEPAAFVMDFARLSGRTAMPPKWALGYMQSHPSLADDEQLIELVDAFRRKKLPVDAILLRDADGAVRGWNSAEDPRSFDADVFGRGAAEVMRDLQERHVQVVLGVTPGPTGGRNPGEDEGGEPAAAPAVAYESLLRLADGVDGFQVDSAAPLDRHASVRRHQLFYEGALAVRPHTRPFSLHGDAFPGAARWGGWMWSGVTEAGWRTLEAQVRVGLNHSLSVSPWWGSDMGGFDPERKVSAELFVRWFQFAAFTPSFATHGREQTRLPWGWEHGDSSGDVDVEAIARQYARLRYRLLPYNYSLARQARDSGMPLMRALWLHYADEPEAAANGREYLWGRDLLIAPVTAGDATTRELYLPRGLWYDWWTGKTETGGATIARDVDPATMPIYVRAGAIVPLDPPRQYASQRIEGATEVRIFRGSDGEFLLYDDDGRTLSYLEGDASLTRFAWDDAAATLTIEPVTSTAASRSDRRRFDLRILPDDRSRTVVYIGRRVTLAFADGQ